MKVSRSVVQLQSIKAIGTHADIQTAYIVPVSVGLTWILPVTLGVFSHLFHDVCVCGVRERARERERLMSDTDL